MVSRADVHLLQLDNGGPVEYPSPEAEFRREIATAQIALATAHQIANRCRSIDPGDTDWLLRAVYVGGAEFWVEPLTRDDISDLPLPIREPF